MSKLRWPKKTTFGEQLRPAMTITDPDEATQYLKDLVEWSMTYHGSSEEEALSIHKSNLGYFAGYYDAETIQRVNKLFNTEHPIFGKTTPTFEEAFEAGKKLAICLTDAEDSATS